MIYHFLLLFCLFCCLLLLGCDIRHNEPLSLSAFCEICIIPSACARVDILLVFIIFQPIHLNPYLYAASFYHFTRPLFFILLTLHMYMYIFILPIYNVSGILCIHCKLDDCKYGRVWWVICWCVCVRAWKWRRLSLCGILLCQLYTISGRCIVKGKVVSIIHTVLSFLFCYMSINKSIPWNKWLYI